MPDYKQRPHSKRLTNSGYYNQSGDRTQDYSHLTVPEHRGRGHSPGHSRSQSRSQSRRESPKANTSAEKKLKKSLQKKLNKIPINNQQPDFVKRFSPTKSSTTFSPIKVKVSNSPSENSSINSHTSSFTRRRHLSQEAITVGIRGYTREDKAAIRRGIRPWLSGRNQSGIFQSFFGGKNSNSSTRRNSSRYLNTSSSMANRVMDFDSQDSAISSAEDDFQAETTCTEDEEQLTNSLRPITLTPQNLNNSIFSDIDIQMEKEKHQHNTNKNINTNSNTCQTHVTNTYAPPTPNTDTLNSPPNFIQKITHYFSRSNTGVKTREEAQPSDQINTEKLGQDDEELEIEQARVQTRRQVLMDAEFSADEEEITMPVSNKDSPEKETNTGNSTINLSAHFPFIRRLHTPVNHSTPMPAQHPYRMTTRSSTKQQNTHTNLLSNDDTLEFLHHQQQQQQEDIFKISFFNQFYTNLVNNFQTLSHKICEATPRHLVKKHVNFLVAILVTFILISVCHFISDHCGQFLGNLGQILNETLTHTSENLVKFTTLAAATTQNFLIKFWQIFYSITFQHIDWIPEFMFTNVTLFIANPLIILPSINLTKVQTTLPDLPKIEMPDMKMPDLPVLPTMPEISLNLEPVVNSANFVKENVVETASSLAGGVMTVKDGIISGLASQVDFLSEKVENLQEFSSHIFEMIQPDGNLGQAEAAENQAQASTTPSPLEQMQAQMDQMFQDFLDQKKFKISVQNLISSEINPLNVQVEFIQKDIQLLAQDQGNLLEKMLQISKTNHQENKLNREEIQKNLIENSEKIKKLAGSINDLKANLAGNSEDSNLKYEVVNQNIQKLNSKIELVSETVAELSATYTEDINRITDNQNQMAKSVQARVDTVFQDGEQKISDLTENLEEIRGFLKNLEVKVKNLPREQVVASAAAPEQTTADHTAEIAKILDQLAKNQNKFTQLTAQIRKIQDQHEKSSQMQDEALLKVLSEMNDLKSSSENSGSVSAENNQNLDQINDKIEKLQLLTEIITQEISHTRKIAVENKPMHVSDLKYKILEQISIYNADKIAKKDFAYIGNGATIISASPPFKRSSALYSVMNVPLFYKYHSPEEVLKAGTLPGDCYPFKGSEGHITIQLPQEIVVTGVTIEHVDARLVDPIETGELNYSSSLRKFSIVGFQEKQPYNTLNSPSNMKMEGFRFSGDMSQDGVFEFNPHRILQRDYAGILEYFEIKNGENFPVNKIEFQIYDNWGNPGFTCVYRLRVHGRRK